MHKNLLNLKGERVKQAPLIVVIYDGIDNSVFDSQVIQPLLKRMELNQAQKIILVSFENKKPTQKTILEKIPTHPSLLFISCKKFPYIGLLNLYFAAFTLQKILKKYSSYDLLARGPLAGFICQKAYGASCNELTIQARGLLSEEYAYERDQQFLGPWGWWYSFRKWQFFALEKKTYTKSSHLQTNIVIQTVSKALCEYLITVYDADRAQVKVSTHDIPATMPPTQLAFWKKEVRRELAIPTDAIVYCYNGSIKPWQCPELAINYFKQIYQKNSRAFLYILTPDKNKFEVLIKKNELPTHSYRIMHVRHNQIYRFLAAADIGIMFRTPHIVNWVSRPTKALEYMSTGLTIEHNNTISWLIEQTKVNVFQQGHNATEIASEQIVSAQAALTLNISS